MPEAFAVLLVFVVAVSAYVVARLQAANPANSDPIADLNQLRQHRGWLEMRREQAERENWDEAMIARLNDEIAATDAQLARPNAPRDTD